MSFRFRIGPFTFGSTGIRLSLWGRNGGISVPVTGKGQSYGKLKVGPVSKYFYEKRTSESWKNDPATERQKSFANDLGIRYPKNITKGELSDLISKAKDKKSK